MIDERAAHRQFKVAWRGAASEGLEDFAHDAFEYQRRRCRVALSMIGTDGPATLRPAEERCRP